MIIKNLEDLISSDILSYTIEYLLANNKNNQEINLMVKHDKDISFLELTSTDSLITTFINYILEDGIRNSDEILNKANEVELLIIQLTDELLYFNGNDSGYQKSLKYKVDDDVYYIYLSSINVFKNKEYADKFLEVLKQEKNLEG